jgi:putative glutamine amidotransferase
VSPTPRRPLIGISTSELRAPARTDPVPEGEPRLPEMALGLAYVRAVERAGGLPVVLPPAVPTLAPPLLERLAGLCLPGGPDIHPSFYGASAHPELGPTEPELDAFEIALARGALERGMPVIGICRGAQLLNVALGGTLHQHVPDAVGDAIPHRQSDDSRRPTHEVRLAGGTHVARAMGGERHEVNSLHHQAVDRLGDGLTAVGWAPDGLVEAVELPGGDGFAVGVQWHAEAIVDRPEELRLFCAFVESAGPG